MYAKASVSPDTLRIMLLLCCALFALGGCYITSTSDAPDGTHPGAVSGGPAPAKLAVKLYPSNELADQTGELTVQVAILTIGRGRFTVDYQGETLVGEAMRVSTDSRHGMASAYGRRGMFARCEYQMNSPRIGGTCAFSNGARYQLRIGS